MKKTAIGLLTVLFMALSASAALIVDFTPVDPGVNVNSRAADSDTTTGDTWNFSDSIALIASGGGSNDRMYGGMVTTWSSPFTYAPALRHLGTTRVTQVQVYPSTTASYSTSAKGIFLWNKADFLNGTDSQTVVFSAGSLLSVNLTTISAATRDFRFVVNQGGTYYVSNSNKTDATAGVFSIDPSTVSWRTVSTDGSYTVGDTASTITLNDVQAVGLYINATRTGTGNLAQTNIQFNDFQAIAIPEPATIGMLGLGGLVALMLRRRCK